MINVKRSICLFQPLLLLIFHVDASIIRTCLMILLSFADKLLLLMIYLMLMIILDIPRPLAASMT